MKELMGWFGKRKSDAVQSGSRGHGLAILDVALDLNRGLAAIKIGDKAEALKCVERMMINEREADRIEDRLCTEITAGALSIQEREDLLHLVRKSDKIADWAMDAGIYMQLMIETNLEVPEFLWESAKLMSDELVLEIKQFLKAIDAVETSPDEARRCVDSIKDQERIIDQMHFTSSKKVLTADIPSKSVMMLRGLFAGMEESSDSCKKCGDTILILLSARRL